MDAVANWMWQGIAVAAAAALLVRAPRSLGATTRYRLWWAALAIVLALPAAPMVVATAVPAPETTLAALETGRARLDPVQVRIGAPRWAPPVLAAVWILWTLVSTARVLVSLVALRRTRRAARPFSPEREARLEHWTAISRSGRRAALVISDHVRYAAVLGGRSPAIALSPAVAAALDDRDLDRIVVHEWAHVQRRDDRARFIQVIVRALAGLHPAVWWLDRQIHLDRETACDDWAVDVTGSAKSYAAALTRLAAIPSAAREDLLQPAAIGSSELTRRVLRLLDARRPPSRRRRDLAPALVVPALCAGAFAVAGVPLISVDLGAVAAARSMLSGNQPEGDAAGSAVVVDASTTQSTAPAPDRPSRADAPPMRRQTHDSAPPPAAAPASALPPGEHPEPRMRLAAQADDDPAPQFGVNAPGELPGTVTSVSLLTPLPVAPPAQTAYDSAPKSPWGAAADAGVNVGRGSQKAAVATAGFFSKLGKSIARSF